MPKEEPDDKPLDPAIEAIRRRMVRTLAISVGIMVIGLAAVLAAIVYKVTTPPGGQAAGPTAEVPSSAPTQASANLPQGFAVTRVGLDGNRILFYGTGANGISHAFVFDIEAGRIVADVTVTR